jgi:hypothetical protein
VLDYRTLPAAEIASLTQAFNTGATSPIIEVSAGAQQMRHAVSEHSLVTGTICRNYVKLPKAGAMQ